MTCIFCEIAKGKAQATVVRTWPMAIAIVPLNPVVPGHRIVIPRDHVADAAASPAITAMTMKHAAEYARDVGQCNLITSIGRAATQTVFHLHIHVVPREEGDGLSLPWTGQEKKVEDPQKSDTL